METFPENDNLLVTEAMLQHLPAPVQRYLRYTGVVGKPWVRTARVKQVGKFRQAADEPWMPMQAEQYFTINPPGFVWKARFKIAGMWLFRARDSYQAGHGHMFGKLAGLYTIFDTRGEQIDQGSLVRYLAEMIWFPTAFLGDNLTWQGVDDQSAQVTLTDSGRSVSARMTFDETGRHVNTIAQRYGDFNGKFSIETWSTPTLAYGMRAGLNLPIHNQVVWKLSSGDLSYWDGENTEVEYNQRGDPSGRW